jgi:hypothetical protein
MCNMDKYNGVVLPPTYSTNYEFLSGIAETNAMIEKEDL